jgi:hypothetical protein
MQVCHRLRAEPRCACCAVYHLAFELCSRPDFCRATRCGSISGLARWSLLFFPRCILYHTMLAPGTLRRAPAVDFAMGPFSVALRWDQFFEGMNRCSTCSLASGVCFRPRMRFCMARDQESAEEARARLTMSQTRRFRPIHVAARGLRECAPASTVCLRGRSD